MAAALRVRKKRLYVYVSSAAASVCCIHSRALHVSYWDDGGGG